MLNNSKFLFNRFSIKKFIDNITILKNEIMTKNEFNFKFEEKYINIFFNIIKNYGIDILYNLKNNSFNSNLYNFLYNINFNQVGYKNFFINQIKLLFIFVYYNENLNPPYKNNDDRIEKQFKILYNNLYILVFKYYSSLKINNNNEILNISDILEIISFNLSLGLTNLINKNNIFNLSIFYLTKFFVDNNANLKEKDIKHFHVLFENLYVNLLANKTNLNFLKRDVNIEAFIMLKLINITCFSSCDTKLKSLIFQILDLLYNKNYSNIISNTILFTIKNSFYQLKKNYDMIKLESFIRFLKGQTGFIDYIFNKEENNKKDEFMPSKYFVLDGSNESGINYNPNSELIKKNFTFVFSFKIEEMKTNIFYPIITFINESGIKDILMNFSIYNKTLCLINQGDTRLTIIDNIVNNKTYLVVVEYFKSKMKIYLNGNKKEFNSININYKFKSSLKIGYIPKDILEYNKIFQLLPNISHFNGIIGTLIFFNNILDEKDFANNIFKLKGRYDEILLLNNDKNIDYYFNYEEYNSFFDNEYIKAKNYFMKLSKKIDEECYFTICPLSMLNIVNQKTNFFVEDIYFKNNKDRINNKDLFPNFNTLQLYSSTNTATYAKQDKKSISTFVEKDGIYIYTLIIEYFYNLLRMLINEPKEQKIEISKEINNTLYHIINSITKIIMFFKINLFVDDLDTFGFSLKKLLNLLIDIEPLDIKLIEIFEISIQKLLDYQKELTIIEDGRIILNFVYKLFKLICSSDYFNLCYCKNAENLFKFLGSIIQNNFDLINIDIMNGLLSFSFVLDPTAFDKHNNKPNGYTFKKNLEYKQMKKEYINLIRIFIKECCSFKLYTKYIENVFKNNICIQEKYKLIKIFYESHNVLTIYDDYIKEKKENELNKSFFDKFKKDKLNDKKDNDSPEFLLNIYKKHLSKLIDISPLLEAKNEKYYELLKSIIILLIYEHQVIIPNKLFMNKENNSKNKSEKNNLNNSGLNNSLEQISFFSAEALDNLKEKKTKNLQFSSSLLNLSPSSIIEKSDEIEKNNNNNNSELVIDFSYEENSESSDKNESSNKSNNSNNNINNIKYNIIFDSLLNSNNLSFYIVKSIFICLCENLDKSKRIKFIKNIDEAYESFNITLGEFNQFKKNLFNQFISLIENLSDEIVLEKSLKLVFSFMKECIRIFKINQKESYSKSLFFHLFESKSIINHFFDFALNNEIITKNSIKDYIISSISDINNNVLSYHPRPYIFSFIKISVKNKISKINQIIKKNCDFLYENFKLGKLSNTNINNYLYFNQIRFIKVLSYIFEIFPIISQKLLKNDDYSLFFSIQNLLIEYFKSEIIFDNRIYLFNPASLNESIKNKDKKELKILQSQETKVINNKIIYINIFELSFLLLFLFLTNDKNNDSKVENLVMDMISKLYDKMSYKGHFISYYFDLLNPFINFSHKKEKNIPEDIIKKINNNYKNSIESNPYIKDTRIISVLLFLIILKYQSLLINYEKMKNYEKIEDFHNKKEIIKKKFQAFVSLSQSDIKDIALNINKIKEDKKFEIILDKEETKNKIFKDYHKNYYKYFLDIILKNKNHNFESIREEIENKFIKDENEKNRITVSFLKSPISSDNKNDKKEKIRKNSYGFYNEEMSEKKPLINLENKKSDKNLNQSKDEIKKEKKISYNFPSLDFENANHPILCTKRDLILKNFGYFYYKYYFKDSKFIFMKKLFTYKFSQEKENNNYNSFEKLMKNKYPSTVKNFSNNILYYPRIFFRPFSKFFDDKYFPISHNYFEEELYLKTKEEKIFHLEYGHGLLNQTNFDLFKLSDNNEDISKKINLSYFSNASNSSEDKEDKCESSKDIGNEEYDNILKKFDKKAKIMKSVHISNKNLVVPFSLENKDDNNSSKNFVRSKFHKKTENKKTVINNKSIFNLLNIYSKAENTKKNLFFKCELIRPKDSAHGKLYFNKNILVFQVNTKFDVQKYETKEKYLVSSFFSDLDQTEKQILIPYNMIFQILLRKFLFFNQAIEIFLFNGKSYFFNLYDEEKRNEFIKKMKEKVKIKNLKKFEIIEDSIEYFNKQKYLNLWLEGKKSTLEYLFLINKFSNRSYNVLSQYLILPWVITDFDDIYKSENYRNMSLPISVQTETALENIKNSYNEDTNNEYKCYFRIFYSASMYICNYLFRIYPFTNNQIKCQGGKFEIPTRQFDSMQDQCNIFKNNCHITTELVPEFYFCPEIFLNLNYCFFGKANENQRYCLVNNLKLGNAFKTIIELINFHQETLDSESVSSQINKWIDNIFGENQITERKNVINSFPKECYEKYVMEEINEKINELQNQLEKLKKKKRLSSITLTSNFLHKDNLPKNNNINYKNKKQIMTDIKKLLMKTYFHGQCPSKLFSKSHPNYTKKPDSKLYSLSSIDNAQIYLKNEYLFIPDKEFLFIKESSYGNYFYILFEDQILVYNKLLKLINNLCISGFCKIYPPYSLNYNSNLKNILKCQYIYKNLIFEALECKYFFVAGYLDNSFKIYTKEKEKTMIYSIYTESKVTCIKNINDSNIFFTGHQNGRIIKWKYTIINKENSKKDCNKFPIILHKINSVYAHQYFIREIEINEKFNCLISAGNDGLIFIRKLYDFEVLNYIKINKKTKEIIDINLYRQNIILSILKIRSKSVYIYTYSLNGMKLGKMSEQIKMPISIIPETGEIFIFGSSNIYLVKITMKEKTSLITITNDLNPSYYEGIKDNSDEYEDSCNKFNDDLNNNIPISYFYDKKYHVLFCLFSNGRLHRINLIKNM